MLQVVVIVFIPINLSDLSVGLGPISLIGNGIFVAFFVFYLHFLLLFRARLVGLIVNVSGFPSHVESLGHISPGLQMLVLLPNGLGKLLTLLARS